MPDIFVLALVRGSPRTRASQKKWGIFICPLRGILLRHQQSIRVTFRTATVRQWCCAKSSGAFPGCGTSSPMAAMLVTNSGRLCGEWGIGPSKSSNGQIQPQASRCYHSDGLLNARWHGLIETDVLPKTWSKPSHRQRLGSSLHTFNFFTRRIAKS